MFAFTCNSIIINQLNAVYTRVSYPARRTTNGIFCNVIAWWMGNKVIKPKRLAGCHQTLFSQSQVGSGHKTRKHIDLEYVELFHLIVSNCRVQY